VGLFPPVFERRVGGRAPVGLLVIAAITIAMVLLLDLNSIASVGSAVALLVFSAVTVAHFRTFRETGAQLWILIVALVATLGTFVIFVSTTLVNEPKTALAVLVIFVVAVVLDVTWSARRRRHPDAARDRASGNQ
jgi:L-asparagine transporter-like permease